MDGGGTKRGNQCRLRFDLLAIFITYSLFNHRLLFQFPFIRVLDFSDFKINYYLHFYKIIYFYLILF